MTQVALPKSFWEVYERNQMKLDKTKSRGKMRQKGEKSYSCEVCRKTFTQLRYLNQHRGVHMTEVKPFVCQICRKTFAQLRYLYQHVKIHTSEGSEPYACNVCDKTFAQMRYLDQHRRIHRSAEETYVCTLTQEIGDGENPPISQQIEIHMAPYVCETCNRAFTQSRYLNQHKKVHTAVKNSYVCEICDKAFSQLRYLKTHRRIHTRSGSRRRKALDEGRTHRSSKKMMEQVEEEVEDDPLTDHEIYADEDQQLVIATVESEISCQIETET